LAASPASGLRSAGASSTGWIRRRWRAAPWSSPAHVRPRAGSRLRTVETGGEPGTRGPRPTRSEQARRTVRAVSTGGRIDVELADLGDLEQVRRLGERLLERLDRLDVLINNAGALLRTYTRAPDGHELTITVHLLAQFALTQGCCRSSRRRALAGDHDDVGRMYTQKFSLGTLVMSEDDYDGTVAYARPSAPRSSSPMNCSAASGPRASTSTWCTPLGRHAGRAQRAAHVHQGRRPAVSDPEVGADTAVWLAGQPTASPKAASSGSTGDPVASTGSRGPTSPKPSSRPTVRRSMSGAR